MAAIVVAWADRNRCLPVAIAGLVIEQSQLGALSPLGWVSMIYMTLIQPVLRLLVRRARALAGRPPLSALCSCRLSACSRRLRCCTSPLARAS
jgi:hypothetical protein